jgi:hypothetical protein
MQHHIQKEKHLGFSLDDNKVLKDIEIVADICASANEGS